MDRPGGNHVSIRSAQKAELALIFMIEISSLYQSLLTSLNDTWKGASSANEVLLLRINLSNSVKKECIGKVREAKAPTEKVLEILHGLESEYTRLQIATQSRI
jgi:hypothetical protein